MVLYFENLSNNINLLQTQNLKNEIYMKFNACNTVHKLAFSSI